MSPFFNIKPQTPCHHCGTPHSQGERYAVRINGINQSMCCPGCQSVAQTIEQLQSLAVTHYSPVD